MGREGRQASGLRAAGVVLLVPLLAGCPAILGIDHEYSQSGPTSHDAGADGRAPAEGGDARRLIDGHSAEARSAEAAGPDASPGDAAPACVVAGASFASGAADPTNPCALCEPSESTSAWSPAVEGTACASGEVCHASVCTSGCGIGTTFYGAGTADPNDPCETCQPTMSTTGWSSVADGTSCGNGQVCASGQCGSGCSIGGTSFGSGAANPGNACQACQPGTSTNAWSSVADGTACGTGEVCSGGSCGAGCFIAGTVYSFGTSNPSNACQSCQPGTSTTAWSSVADGTTCGTGGLSCMAGQCACPTGSPTQISGQVMDPGMNVPLSNVAVYVVAGSPIALPDEPANATAGALPSCDTCASLASPGMASGVATDVSGHFALPVSPGTHTVVAQLGRWRRIVPNVSVSVCQNVALGNDAIRLPASRAEGDIPKMAVVEGQEESLECWLRKIGIAASEIAPYAAGSANRVQLYSTPNAGGAGVNYWNGTTYVKPPSAAALWDSASANTLNEYSAVLFACDGETPVTADAAAQTAMVNYGNAGGRLFLDHLPGTTWLELATQSMPTLPASGWSTSAVATWNPSASNSVAPAVGTVLDTTAEQQAMYAWLSAWDNTPDGAGKIQSEAPRLNAVSVGSASLELVAFKSAPLAVASFWFNTPITAAPGSYCGRAVYNDTHVAVSRSSNLNGGTTAATTFPGSCSTAALTSEELAMEYELFALSACAPGSVDPL